MKKFINVVMAVSTIICICIAYYAFSLNKELKEIKNTNVVLKNFQCVEGSETDQYNNIVDEKLTPHLDQVYHYAFKLTEIRCDYYNLWRNIYNRSLESMQMNCKTKNDKALLDAFAENVEESAKTNVLIYDMGLKCRYYYKPSDRTLENLSYTSGTFLRLSVEASKTYRNAALLLMKFIPESQYPQEFTVINKINNVKIKYNFGDQVDYIDYYKKDNKGGFVNSPEEDWYPLILGN